MTTSTLDRSAPADLQHHDWHSWHLHLGTKAMDASDRVITDVIGGVVGQLPSPWFFVRYWQAGPHVRLRVAGLDRAAASSLADQLSMLLASHAAVAPGEHPVDPADYVHEASRHATGESGENRQVHELRAPGVYAQAYEPELERYGGLDAMARSEALFHTSSRVVLALLGKGIQRAGRTRAALIMTEAAAAALGGEDRAIYFAIGREMWIQRAMEYRFSEAQIGLALDVSQVQYTPTDTPAWAQTWRTETAALERLLAPTQHIPGSVISSQVHMTHNRLGLGILDELRTYAILARAFPTSAEPEPVTRHRARRG